MSDSTAAEQQPGRHRGPASAEPQDAPPPPPPGRHRRPAED
ncbi:hypothetical protein [Actinacidiphila cocklensis]|jgi:hypothetical protein|uniref:Uncharacterized protein n=1 Tax=Actinacidiphila cocklensis TaxID=887465 RepID=A0A9W4GQH5_9ACTN|nr:hypothetical protein [Actinacidiphila cocklensis]WSX74274.1 hypothetical protein OH826_10575 [Streptomyces sp. NBC_00899]WSX79661.1 hypothetical protein OH826_40930 [Streptomyces sp. NBC_00899]CAG6392684.1 conserved hypothetical protein [Actinacidiphila cocklensis]